MYLCIKMLHKKFYWRTIFASVRHIIRWIEWITKFLYMCFTDKHLDGLPNELHKKHNDIIILPQWRSEIWKNPKNSSLVREWDLTSHICRNCTTWQKILPDSSRCYKIFLKYNPSQWNPQISIAAQQSALIQVTHIFLAQQDLSGCRNQLESVVNSFPIRIP